MLSAVDSGNGLNYVTGATYGPDNALTGFKRGHGVSFDGITNIVDVYIRHLRNKVDSGHDSKLLCTVRGVGYTIREGAEA